MSGARYTVEERAFGARDILLIPAGQRRAVRWLHHAGIVSLRLSERFIAETVDVAQLILPDFSAVQDRFVTVAAAELYRSIGAGESISPAFAEALAVGVAHRVAAIASGSDARKPVTRRRLTQPLVRRIDRYIDDNLERRFGLPELAMVAGLSRWHFLRIFRETVGVSPHDYVTQRRLERAQHLLRTTGRSVMDIAGDVGMTHSHFSRVFSRRLGVTPTVFRRRSPN
jgi:AraC family transcriptional regulator